MKVSRAWRERERSLESPDGSETHEPHDVRVVERMNQNKVNDSIVMVKTRKDALLHACTMIR